VGRLRRTTSRTVPSGGRTKAGTVSVAAALAVVAGLLQFTSGPAVAAGGADMPTVTLPGAHREAPRQAFMVAADDSGYLSVPNGNSVRWIGHDGSTRVVSYVSGTVYNGGLGLDKIPQTPPTRNVYEIRRYATNKVTRFTLAAGDRATEVFAENRLLVVRSVGGKWTLHLLEVPAGGGQPVDRPVTGVADDFSGTLYVPTSDERGAAFEYISTDGNNTRRTALLDFDTASLTYVPSDGIGSAQYPSLAGDKVNLYAYDVQSREYSLYVVDREHPEVPGHLIDVPQNERGAARTIGDWVVYHAAARDGIVAVPVTGGPARTLLTASFGGFVAGADGSLFVAGGTDADHWAVQHITLGTDGAPVVKPVSPLPAVSMYEAGGVAVDQGRVLLGTERKDGFSPYLSTDLTASALSLTADGTLTAAPPQNLGDLGYDEPNPTYHVSCYNECLRFTGTGEGTVPHREAWALGSMVASGSYWVTRSSGNQQVVRDGDQVLATGSWPSAALWGNTLWTPGTDARGKPVFDRFSLPTMRKLGSLSLGSCRPSDLQVVGRYVYWSCGPNAQAVVYDQVKRTTQNVPRGYARLADGYLVSQDDKAGKLLITYLKAAVPANKVGTKVLGPLPSPLYAPADRRGRFWNVDRFGGPVAYFTASGDVTVKWPQVTTSPLAATDATVPTSIDLRQGGSFEGVWHLNKPTANWKLTVTTSTGAVVRTLTGGRAHGKISVTWDRRAANGTQVRTGDYRVTLTARTANGTPRNAVIYDKPLAVRPVERHDLGRDGIGDLITFDSVEHMAIHAGTGRGTFDSANKVVSEDGWYRSPIFVPFGDLSGDACNSLLVRDFIGQLTRYEGTCGKPFTPSSPHRVLGTDFGGYDVLTSPGDLTGDGLADLVARDKAGVLWRYSADGRGGLAEPVRLSEGQGGYTRLVGAGDLNRDGIGDMVGLDGKGALWRWLGDGKGGFGAPVRIAQGISVKALAAPGDLTGDGRPDLVGLDTAGTLWRWNGTSAATFGAKTRIATGWQGYKALY
jgi:hypothetical protein